MGDKPEVKKGSLKVPERIITNIGTTLKGMINIQLEWTQEPKGEKLVEIDVPFIKGYMNVKIGFTDVSRPAAEPDQMICIGHIVIKK